MELVDDAMRFDRVYNHAASYKRQLDSKPAFFEEELAQIKTEGFLKDRIKNPTIADAVMHEYVKGHPYENPRYQIINNLANFEKTPEIDVLIKQDEENYNRLYSKTRNTRKALIRNDRIDLYSTTPKLKGIKKFFLKLKTLI